MVEFPEPVAKREQAIRAWKLFKAQDVDAVILFNGTFNTGELTAEIIRNLECPFALWGIGELALASRSFTGSMVGVMAAGALFKNFDKPFSFIYGPVGEERAQRKLRVFVGAVRAIAYLREATIGVIGMRPDGFQIAGFDELAVKQVFGTEITKVSMYEFTNIIRAIEREGDRPGHGGPEEDLRHPGQGPAGGPRPVPGLPGGEEGRPGTPPAVLRPGLLAGAARQRPHPHLPGQRPDERRRGHGLLRVRRGRLPDPDDGVRHVGHAPPGWPTS